MQGPPVRKNCETDSFFPKKRKWSVFKFVALRAENRKHRTARPSQGHPCPLRPSVALATGASCSIPQTRTLKFRGRK